MATSGRPVAPIMPLQGGTQRFEVDNAMRIDADHLGLIARETAAGKNAGVIGSGDIEA